MALAAATAGWVEMVQQATKSRKMQGPLPTFLHLQGLEDKKNNRLGEDEKGSPFLQASAQGWIAVREQRWVDALVHFERADQLICEPALWNEIQGPEHYFHPLWFDVNLSQLRRRRRRQQLRYRLTHEWFVHFYGRAKQLRLALDGHDPEWVLDGDSLVGREDEIVGLLESPEFDFSEASRRLFCVWHRFKGKKLRPPPPPVLAQGEDEEEAEAMRQEQYEQALARQEQYRTFRAALFRQRDVALLIQIWVWNEAAEAWRKQSPREELNCRQRSCLGARLWLVRQIQTDQQQEAAYPVVRAFVKLVAEKYLVSVIDVLSIDAVVPDFNFHFEKEEDSKHKHKTQKQGWFAKMHQNASGYTAVLSSPVHQLEPLIDQPDSREQLLSFKK